MELDLSDVQLATGTIHIGCLRDISERQTLHRGAPAPGAARQPHRPAQPRAVRGPRRRTRSGRRCGPATSLALLVMDLDEFKQRQRHARAPARRRAAQARHRTARRLPARRRHGGAARRRRVRDPAARRPPTWRAPRRSSGRSSRRSSRPSSSTATPSTCRRASASRSRPLHGDNVDDLLRRADLAMYDAKRSGDGLRAVRHRAGGDPGAPPRAARRPPPLHRARRAGPALPAEDRPRDAARSIGVEALIRWNHPSGRLFMPDRVHARGRAQRADGPDHGVGHQRGRCASCAAWRDEGYDLTMAVNLGARCLAEGSAFFETVDELIRDAGTIPPDKLTFELTESALIDTAVPGMLAQLQTMDERLSIDDFGTGYSSLVYLQRLPVVEIKADRSFVMTMCSVKDDAVIVRSIIDLAHNLGVQRRRRGRRGQGDDGPAQRVRLRRGPGLLLQPPDAGRGSPASGSRPRRSACPGAWTPRAPSATGRSDPRGLQLLLLDLAGHDVAPLGRFTRPCASRRLSTTGQRLQRGPLLQQRSLGLIAFPFTAGYVRAP